MYVIINDEQSEFTEEFTIGVVNYDYCNYYGTYIMLHIISKW